MGSLYRPLSSTELCLNVSTETSECFICRDVELQASDPLRNFCDCKNLLAHHVCLSTWIQRGGGSEDRLRCIICKAEYQLQRRSPWRSIPFQWQMWLVLIAALVLLALVPYAVYCMLTSLTNPPPPITFKVAAATFGCLTEILLIKCLSSFLGSQYRHAEQSAFTVRPRGLAEDKSKPGCWGLCKATSAAASPSQEDGRKVDVS
ncbi:hypothetical protein Q5P01_016473 [Channa striata]|uniref:RING-CH-type domain-containing protein n=1 Tax=Channa striata TaxID=64152 RepID=A0AA88SE44_CHASR|nr:hypothetical protein Q5P01_016473 [Channa striata]